MDKLTKILIVIVVILVAGFSLTIGFLLGNHLNQPVNVVNNTTDSTNSSSQDNQTNSTHQNQQSKTNNYISKSQAINIAKSAWPVPGATYSISTYPTSDSPYYDVNVHVKGSTGPDGFVDINAYTGKVTEAGT